MTTLSAEWESFKRDATETPLETVVHALKLTLRREGGDLVGHCPAGCTTHGDGFIVTPKKKLFLCRPSGVSGDGVDMVMHAMTCDFATACEFINDRPRPDKALDESAEKKEERLAQAHVRRMAAKRELERQAKEDANKKRRDEDAIELVLSRCVPIAGTQAEAYLIERGATPTKRLVVDLLYCPELDYWGYAETADAYFRARPDLDPAKDHQPKQLLASVPAMVARVRDVDDGVIALHQTYLDPSGAPRKWTPIGDRDRNSAKKFRGQNKGGLIRLGRMTDVVAIGEGVETTLAWYALGLNVDDVSLAAAGGLSAIYGKATGAIPHPTIRRPDGKPVWIPNGLPDMTAPGAGLRDDVREVILLGDGDSERQATQMKLVTGARRLVQQGRMVNLHMAPNGADWADVAAARSGKAVEQGARVAFFESLATVEIPAIVDSATFISAAEAEAKPFKSNFGALFLDELDNPGPEHEWLVDGILSVGDKSVVGGPSQSGKSFLAIHIGMVIAHARDFFGLDVKPGLVVYQAGEGARGVKKRLRAWRQHFGVEYTRETPFVLLQGPVDLYAKEGDTTKLIEEIRAIQRLYALPLRLVVFDTLACAATGADENSARDIGMVFANISKINAELQSHVMLVHHMNAGGEKLRGSTAIYANIDQTIFVSRDPETKIRTSKLGKQRDEDDDDAAWQWELKRIELVDPRTKEKIVDQRGEPVTSCVCVPIGEKEAVRRSEEFKGFVLRPKTDEEPFMKAFFAASEKWGQPVPPSLAIDPRVRTIVDYNAVKQTFFEQQPDDEPSPVIVGESREASEKRKLERDKKRRARMAIRLRDTRERLARYGVIDGVDHNGVWVIWWTGKPIRGFPETLPEVEREPFFRGGDDDIPF